MKRILALGVIRLKSPWEIMTTTATLISCWGKDLLKISSAEMIQGHLSIPDRMQAQMTGRIGHGVLPGVITTTMETWTQ